MKRVERSREAAGISPTFIWAYEEPENNLEFRRAQALADAFHKLAEGELSQVLLTTHSPIFYNMHQEDGGRGLCCAYHLTNEGPTAGTEARSAAEASVSLDESMGAIAIIAPHIRAAQVALAEASSQAADLRTQLEQFNQANLPTIFVEGPTDYIVFRRLLQLFRAEQAEQVFLAEPPPRAGANYVTNMLRSWEFRTKHLQVPQRRSAVGIIDGDAEGAGAHERFQNEDVTWKHVSIIRLGQPTHLNEACELGITVPICLEELWPSAVWQHAEQQGWLSHRSKKGLLGEKLLQWLTDYDERLSELIDDAWRPYFERRVNDDQASTAKADWAAYIAGLPRAQIEPIAAEHLKIFDEAISRLGV